MGFTEGSALTIDADLTKYHYEPQITNLQRGGVDFDDLHIGAVNTLIAEHLRPKGFTTTAQLAAIANASDFKPALTAWVLSKIFANQGARAVRQTDREEALTKAQYYERKYEESLAKVVIDDGDSTFRQRRGLPMVVNVDAGSMYPALGSIDRPTSVARDEIEGYEDLVIEGK